MNQQQGQFSQIPLIDFMAVIDIDPSLSFFKPTQQKWISSLQLLSDIPKQLKSNSKHLMICPGLHMVIYFCQKNRLPIYEIDFICQPGPQWISLKMPHNFMDKFGDYFLCYKTEQLQLAGALGDIDILNTQKKSNLQVVNVPNGYKVISSSISHNYLIYKRIKSRLEQTFKPIIAERYPQNNKFNVGLLPSFCFPDGIKLYKQLKGFITFSFILTQQTGQRLYITYLTFKELLNQNLKNKLNVRLIQKIYYDKGFCIVSKLKFSDQLSECLQHLYRLSMSRNDLPFYKVAQNFVDELRLPKQIKTYGFSYSYSGCNITFQSDQTLDKVSEKSIYCIFKFLPVSAILTIFEAILLQKHVLFVSQSKTILGYAIQAFTSLLFPFRWENPIIPIIPMTLKELLNAPVPIIAAILPSLLDCSIQSETLIVQLDTGELVNDEDLPPLPEKLQKQLRKRLEQFQIFDADQVREYLQNPQNTYIFKMQQIENPNFKGSIIRDIFFQFFLTLMKNYKKFWKPNKFKEVKQTSSANYTQPQLINDIFRVQDFLSDLGMSKVGSFGYKFSEGTIFTAFLERRHQNNDDHIGNFFDQCLQRKKVKKDAILINPIQKIRYLVAKHPQPQNPKTFYSYDIFPSILQEKKVYFDEIQIKIDEQIDIFQKEERQIIEFIQDQRQININFFEPLSQSSVKDQKDYPILSLLTNKNKEIYFQKKKDKDKNSYVLFKEIYQVQIEQIQSFMNNWPKPRRNEQTKFVAIQKLEYLKMKIQKRLSKEENIILGICENQNYQLLIKGQLKIVITGCISMINEQQLRVSSKCLKKLSICIQDYRIRKFINHKMSLYSSQIIDFILDRAKSDYSSQWNIQTLIDLRQYIQNKGEKQVK